MIKVRKKFAKLVAGSSAAEYLRIGGYRIFGMLGGGVVGTIAVWIIVSKFGPAGFALFSLLATILIMLPFADLGLGASAVNIASDYEAGRLTYEQLATRYSKIRSILSLVGLVVICLAVLIGLLNGWTILLGEGLDSQDAQVAVTVMFTILGLSIPLGVGARIMQGRGAMDRVTKISTLNPIIQLILIIPSVLLLPSAAFVAFLPALAYFSVAAFTDYRSRRIDGRVLPFIPRFGNLNHPISGLWKSSLSFMIMSLGMLFIFQSQRIILAHRSTVDALAQFSLVAQYLIPVLALVVAVSQALWPKYRNAGAGLTTAMFKRHVLFFFAGGLAGSALMCCAVLAVSHGLFGSKIDVSWGMLLAASVYLTAMATYQPCSMVLTSPDGLRIQSVLTVITSTASVALGLALAPSLGSEGAFTSAAVSVILIQLSATYSVALRHVRLSALVHTVFQQPV
ncbi:hypothetical protein [Rhodococcus sp. IEGM 1343]|uniref:hypothetical protein n=1 Tax=Rhodococcus sp. IEGM 1343 TaxID=3082224 RepID=UPI002953E6D5|nr:hypothetical protein [Rhodococcus sp. IEGM 1343]MDV8055978.1 hypothetical protein [Rhodococcus sp. IEGM 1343]